MEKNPWQARKSALEIIVMVSVLPESNKDFFQLGNQTCSVQKPTLKIKGRKLLAW